MSEKRLDSPLKESRRSPPEGKKKAVILRLAKPPKAELITLEKSGTFHVGLT